MVDVLQDKQNRKEMQENRAAEWVQSHWLGYLERKSAKKGKKGRKGKKKKK